MVGITSVNQEQVDQFIDDTGITYAILQDESSNLGNRPGGFGGVTYDDYYIPNQGSPYPRDFIVDQDGILVYAIGSANGRRIIINFISGLSATFCGGDDPDPEFRFAYLSVVDHGRWFTCKYGKQHGSG